MAVSHKTHLLLRNRKIIKIVRDPLQGITVLRDNIVAAKRLEEIVAATIDRIEEITTAEGITEEIENGSVTTERMTAITEKDRVEDDLGREVMKRGIRRSIARVVTVWNLVDHRSTTVMLAPPMLLSKPIKATMLLLTMLKIMVIVADTSQERSEVVTHHQ